MQDDEVERIAELEAECEVLRAECERLKRQRDDARYMVEQRDPPAWSGAPERRWDQ